MPIPAMFVAAIICFGSAGALYLAGHPFGGAGVLFGFSTTMLSLTAGMIIRQRPAQH